MPNSIQPREYSKGSGSDDISYDSDGDPNLLNANRSVDGRWLNANYDNPGNRWNRDNGFAFAVPQLSSFPRLFFGTCGVLFNKLPTPPSEHFAYLVYFKRECNILSVIKGFGFPEYHQKYFERIHFLYRQTNIGQFLFTREKTGSSKRFYDFYEQTINPAPKGISMCFGYRLVICVPKQIGALHLLQKRQ